MIAQSAIFFFAAANALMDGSIVVQYDLLSFKSVPHVYPSQTVEIVLSKFANRKHMCCYCVLPSTLVPTFRIFYLRITSACQLFFIRKRKIEEREGKRDTFRSSKMKLIR